MRSTGFTPHVSPGSTDPSPSPSNSTRGSSIESYSTVGCTGSMATCHAPRPYVPAVTRFCGRLSFRSVTTRPSGRPFMYGVNVTPPSRLRNTPVSVPTSRSSALSISTLFAGTLGSPPPRAVHPAPAFHSHRCSVLNPPTTANARSGFVGSEATSLIARLGSPAVMSVQSKPPLVVRHTRPLTLPEYSTSGKLRLISSDSRLPDPPVRSAGPTWSQLLP